MAPRLGSGMTDPRDGAGPSRRPPHVRGRSGGGLSWAWVVLGVLCGIGLVVLGIRDGHPVDVVVGVVVMALCIVLSRPSRQAIGRRLVAGRPRADVGSAPVVVYWRADDLRSVRLRGALRDVRDELVWVNNFWDAEGERLVRQYHDGHELLPMVMIDGQPFLDPAPDVVRAAVEEHRDEQSRHRGRSDD